jgi:predicted Zn-dependent protease
MVEVMELADRVLDRAGADTGKLEAYVEHRVVTTVQAGTGGSLRHVGRADTLGVGIRAVSGDHVGYASTSDVTDAGIAAVVARARANGQVSDPDRAGAQLPAPGGTASVEGPCQSLLVSMPLHRKVALATGLASRVTALDSRIRGIDTAEWRDDHRRVAVSSTDGMSVAYETAFAELSCDALGEDEHGDANDYSYWWGRDPSEVDVD